MIVGRPFACCPSSQSSKECCCPCRQLKYRLLFHYYSSSSKILDLNDMNKMIIDYKRKTKNFLPPRYSGEKIINGNPNNNNNNSSNDNNESMPQNRQQLEERFRSQSQIPMELTFKQFYHHIQNGQLFRLLFGLDNNMNVEEYFDKIIRINIEIDDLILPLWRPLTSTSQWIALQSSTQSTLRCYSCKRTRYYLSTYFHTLSEIGEVTEVNRLDIENISPSAINGVGVMTTTTTATNAQNVARQFRQDMQENEIHVLANDLINRLTKIGSFLFDSSNDNEIVNVDQLTLLENWFYKEKIEMINNLKMICQKAEEIFALEPRLLNVCFEHFWKKNFRKEFFFIIIKILYPQYILCKYVNTRTQFFVLFYSLFPCFGIYHTCIISFFLIFFTSLLMISFFFYSIDLDFITMLYNGRYTW